MTAQPIRSPVRIIGIDPGLRRTGWGVIDVEGNRLMFVACGSVETRENLPLAEPDRGTYYGGDERGYTDYPSLDEVGAFSA